VKNRTAASQTLDRAVAVLQAVAGSRANGLNLSAAVHKTGLTKPTTRRLLLALIDNGLVEQREVDGRYYVGAEISALGMLASELFCIHRLAAECLVDLATRSGESALLSARRGYATVCLAREEGTFPLRSQVLQPGDRHPLGVGGGGLALLAMLPDLEVDEALARNARWFAESYQALTPELLRRQVQETRERGYAVNPGLIIKGSWAVGVAIQDPRGGDAAALTLAGVEGRFTEAHVRTLASMLQEEKVRLETRMLQHAPASRQNHVLDARCRESRHRAVSKGRSDDLPSVRRRS
jgi:DNA-binding IclR family transcriptional regulator